MAERVVWDEPTEQRHRVAGLTPEPDRQRPGFVDPRVVRLACGEDVALVGIKPRPPALSDCEGCFGG